MVNLEAAYSGYFAEPEKDEKDDPWQMD